MELKLEHDLAHQLVPVDNVATVVEASIRKEAEQAHQNPLLHDKWDLKLTNNVRPANIKERYIDWGRMSPSRLPDKVKALPPHNVLDVRMETGTGKTYVYTRTIYELHKRCGFNKFIIAVPTLPIKAGTAAFLDDQNVLRHFRDVCGYNSDIELCLLEPQKQKKKGKLTIPTSVSQFFNGTNRNKKKIYVLLTNIQLLTTGKLLTRTDFDQLNEFDNLAAVIRDTRPVLIIDEPHRMERMGASYAKLIESFRPQLVLRYGATFPELTFGKGRNRFTKKDYQELIYELNAADAFNQELIKGVAKEHLELPGGRTADKKVKIVGMAKGDSVTVRLTAAGATDKTHILHAGESLGVVDGDLDGIVIEQIGAQSILLSNGQEKFNGDEFYPDQFSLSYQEGMIELALMRHFETERANFSRNGLPIKTLALFFIDNIESFRGPEGKNDGWLRMKFLDLLKTRVNKELAKENTEVYAAYLRATLANLDGTCAAYFSRDNNDTDENIAAEVKVILHGKKELLSLKDKDGNPNVLRFLFSKWTLKEGWDNPNVFTICKLRSSGSEISKLQEVGRGLRLPVDIAGNRISDGGFMLNYIVDFTEKDFAIRLVAEINGDLGNRTLADPMQITVHHINQVGEKRGMERKAFQIQLLQEEYIELGDDGIRIKADKFDDMLKAYPEFVDLIRGVSATRIINRNSNRGDKVHIRKARFDELRELWAQLNRKYVLFFDSQIDGRLEEALPALLRDKNVFSYQSVHTNRVSLDWETGRVKLKEEAHKELTLRGRHYPYNVFLQKASRFTNIPLSTLHRAICQAADDGLSIKTEMMTDDSLARLIAAVDDWKCEELVGRVRYKQADYRVKETKLTNADGTVKDEVVQTYIGQKMVLGTPPAKYLYDAYAYDSELELQNMKKEIEEVVVYGKIPSHSICIPTVASSNYSPDFMYVVKKADGTKELNIVIETKAYDKETNIPPDENSKIECAEEFFNAMTRDGYTVRFQKQLNSISVRAIIDELMK